MAQLGLLLFAALFIVAGMLHFLFPAPYIRIIPPFLPAPRVLVWISGAAEILGGLRAGASVAGDFPREYLYGGREHSLPGSSGETVGPVAAASAANPPDLVGAALYEGHVMGNLAAILCFQPSQTADSSQLKLLGLTI
ncbi:MAG: hypothetical protein ACRD2U_14150 [Terriglobales bacterium]